MRRETLLDVVASTADYLGEDFASFLVIVCGAFVVGLVVYVVWSPVVGLVCRCRGDGGRGSCGLLESASSQTLSRESISHLTVVSLYAERRAGHEYGAPFC